MKQTNVGNTSKFGENTIWDLSPLPLILQPRLAKLDLSISKKWSERPELLRTGGRRQLMMRVRMPRARRSLFLEGNTCLGVRGCLGAALGLQNLSLPSIAKIFSWSWFWMVFRASKLFTRNTWSADGLDAIVWSSFWVFSFLKASPTCWQKTDRIRQFLEVAFSSSKEHSTGKESESIYPRK